MIIINVLYAILISTIAGMSTLLGGIIIYLNIKPNNINKFITLCLMFSLTIMIGISITDLIPNSFFYVMLSYSSPVNILIILSSFFIGVILVYIVNKGMDNSNNALYKLGILSMLALILHNFPEGIATFISSIKDVNLGIKLSIAIMLHNIPEGISIAVPIYYSTQSKKKALLYTFLSGLAEPLGAVLAYLFLKNYVTDLMLSIVLLLVAGIMITLSIHEMFPKAKSYNENNYLYVGLFLGIILIVINHFVF